MGQDFDIQIATIKKKIEIDSEERLVQEDTELFEKQIRYLTDKISGFSFEMKIFCDGLFSMLMPADLFGEPIVENNVFLFHAVAEKMVLTVKSIQSEQKIEFGKIKTDYINQMKQAKQQTKIDVSDKIQAAFGDIYYFLAIHAMPGTELCDFIVLFQMQKKIVFMDFNFDIKESFFWKTILIKLCSTIKEGELNK